MLTQPLAAQFCRFRPACRPIKKLDSMDNRCLAVFQLVHAANISGSDDITTSRIDMTTFARFQFG